MDLPVINRSKPIMGKLDGSERIICVPAQALKAAGGLSGFLGGRNDVLYLLDRVLPHAQVRPRTESLESDPSWLQLIAYGVLTCKGKVFAYRRRKAGTEGRLHGKASLGIGGHVEARDARGLTVADFPMITVTNSMTREIDEEVAPAGAMSLRIAGILHDDREPARDGKVPVGLVHLGIVYEIKLGSEAITPAAEIEPLGWLDPGDLMDAKGMEWESWSGLLVDQWLPSLASSPVG
jgi:predicted NUDIX family phosphoesterase